MITRRLELTYLKQHRFAAVHFDPLVPSPIQPSKCSSRPLSSLCSLLWLLPSVAAVPPTLPLRRSRLPRTSRFWSLSLVLVIGALLLLPTSRSRSTGTSLPITRPLLAVTSLRQPLPSSLRS